MAAGCYLLQISFATPVGAPTSTPLWPFLAGGGLLAGLLFAVWQRSVQVRSPAASPAVEALGQLRFGQSCLHVASQTLTAGAEQHNLTYREAKLLRLLVNHPNQVLERDQLLKLVWEDEGVTVGRSLDVFISRLRKLLSSDPTIRIVAVHGVGYRMDVQELAIP
jgi:DNA-binding response OmpR family regulator